MSGKHAASGSYHGPQRKSENREALSGRERRSGGVRVRKAPPGNRANTGVAGKKNTRERARKKANRERLTLVYWWRNAEPNPRPLSETDSNRWVLRARIRPFGRVCSQQRYIFDQTRPASLSFDLIIRVVCPRVRRTTPRPVCASNAHQANLSCHAGNCSVKRLPASTEGDSMAASLYP